MIVYLIRRSGAALITLWIAVTLAFIALRIIPGDAIAAQLARGGASPAQIAQRRAELGLDQPVPIQYARTLGSLVRGDLGSSFATGRSVSETISEQVGATVTLAAGGLVVALIAGIGLGMLASASRWRALRGLAALVVALLLSTPVYWSGTLAIYVFSVGLRWLPSTGSGDLRHLLLPWLTLGLGLSGSIARVTTNSLEETRSADFVRTAHGKGLREWQVLFQHALRAGLGPIVAVIALQVGFLLGGAVVTEALFVRQGIGQVLLSAINDKDFPVVQGIVILSAVIYSLTNMAADVLTAALDPRIRINSA